MRMWALKWPADGDEPERFLYDTAEGALIFYTRREARDRLRDLRVKNSASSLYRAAFVAPITILETDKHLAPHEARDIEAKLMSTLDSSNAAQLRMIYLPRFPDQGQREVILQFSVCENLVMALEIFQEMNWSGQSLHDLVTYELRNLTDERECRLWGGPEAARRFKAEYARRLQARFDKEGERPKANA